MCPAADPLWRRCLHAPWHLARQDAECAFEHVATSVLGLTLALTLALTLLSARSATRPGIPPTKGPEAPRWQAT